jgi:uncharacterized protein
MKDLLQRMVEDLVIRPDAIRITETQVTSALVLELRVAKEDLGRVIGKRGLVSVCQFRSVHSLYFS